MVESDPKLFAAPQTLVARSAGQTVRARIPVEGPATVRVPVAPGADGHCTIALGSP